MDRKYDVYVDGNTVRRMAAVPDERQERARREIESRRAKNKRLAKHNQERELRMNRGYFVFSAAAVCVAGIVCVAYIQLQSQITTRMSNISALEKEITELKTENDTALKRINTSIDLNKIKEEAMGKYGMVYANEDQVVYYDIENADFMTQYEEIPEK